MRNVKNQMRMILITGFESNKQSIDSIDIFE